MSTGNSIQGQNSQLFEYCHQAMGTQKFLVGAGKIQSCPH